MQQRKKHDPKWCEMHNPFCVICRYGKENWEELIKEENEVYIIKDFCYDKKREKKKKNSLGVHKKELGINENGQRDDTPQLSLH